MADLIYRNYLIEKFSYTGAPAVSEMGKGYDLGIAAALRVVKNAPSVSRWIPCSERLPDIDVPVLTWDGRYTSVERRIEYFLYYDEETGHIERQYGEYWIDGVEGDEENPIGLRDGTATHWMPLPEPPEPPESEVQDAVQ